MYIYLTAAETQSLATTRPLRLICTAVASPAGRSTVLWLQCVTVSIRLQAEYTRPRPHHRANVLGQLGKCGVTRQLRRNSIGRMGVRSVV